MYYILSSVTGPPFDHLLCPCPPVLPSLDAKTVLPRFPRDLDSINVMHLYEIWRGKKEKDYNRTIPFQDSAGESSFWSRHELAASEFYVLLYLPSLWYRDL